MGVGGGSGGHSFHGAWGGLLCGRPTIAGAAASQSELESIGRRKHEHPASSTGSTGWLAGSPQSIAPAARPRDLARC